MIQAVEQTKEEKREMYRKLPIDDVIDMLITCNELIDANMGEINACDICGRHPNVIIKTQFGQYCQEHAKYV